MNHPQNSFFEFCDGPNTAIDFDYAIRLHRESQEAEAEIEMDALIYSENVQPDSALETLSPVASPTLYNDTEQACRAVEPAQETIVTPSERRYITPRAQELLDNENAYIKVFGYDGYEAFCDPHFA